MLQGSLFVRDFDTKNGTTLKFTQSEVGDVGCVVWDAALVLSSYLETEHCTRLLSNDFKCRKVVELGAGTGICGIQSAFLG